MSGCKPIDSAIVGPRQRHIGKQGVHQGSEARTAGTNGVPRDVFDAHIDAVARDGIASQGSFGRSDDLDRRFFRARHGFFTSIAP